MDKKIIFERINQLGIAPRKSLGQNFLISSRSIEKIIERVKKVSSRNIVEIGPGLGSLTELLLPLGASLQLIELDRAMAQYWRERGVAIIEKDALKFDWSQLNWEGEGLLVSNLPYQISSRIVIDRSLAPHGVSHMVLMFQKEVAQKIVCHKGTEDYGLLSVIAQIFWKIEFILEAAPAEFYPPPKVASRVLHFVAKGSQDVEDLRKGDFFFMVKSAFSHRRKLMAKNLSPWLKQKHLEGEKLVGVMAAMKLNEKVRAEELSPQEFVELYRKLVD